MHIETKLCIFAAEFVNINKLKSIKTTKIMELLTEHFDITNNRCYLDLLTDTHVYYLEFNNENKLIDKMEFLIFKKNFFRDELPI